MERYMLCDLIWVYDFEKRNLSVFVKNSENTRVKNIMDGSIYEIPTYRGEYGMIERRLDFKKILNTKDYQQLKFKELYMCVGIKAFTTLSKEAKQVEKEINRQRKDIHYCDYSEYDSPEINVYQYMSDDDIIAATQKAETILQKDPAIKRREENCKYGNSYEF